MRFVVRVPETREYSWTVEADSIEAAREAISVVQRGIGSPLLEAAEYLHATGGDPEPPVESRCPGHVWRSPQSMNLQMGWATIEPEGGTPERLFVVVK